MIFVDHKTKLVYPYFQETKTKTGAEACSSKRDYETFAKRYNVDIDKYHTDNGAFRTLIFQKEIEAKGQNISFSGVTHTMTTMPG
jgi:chloramphenicol O-acetyltransferase